MAKRKSTKGQATIAAKALYYLAFHSLDFEDT
jgi:hypothetical protein